MSNAPLDQSGVWRYREFLPFLDDYSARRHPARRQYAAARCPARRRIRRDSTRITFKHQGFNPTGSFKDNGMTCGAAQARAPGDDSASPASPPATRRRRWPPMPAPAGLQPIIFIPHGNISFGKLAQALEYGAKTFQVDANFDQILALVRALAERLGIYLLNSINPFRIEGQKTIMVEMMDQRDWQVPDWVVLPGGNLGNASAFGKALREMQELGLIDRLPRLAVVQAEGSAPFYELMHSDRARPAAGRPSRDAGHRDQDRRPGVLAQGAARDSAHERRRGEGHGAGDRRRQSRYRAVRNRLRAGSAATLAGIGN